MVCAVLLLVGSGSVSSSDTSPSPPEPPLTAADREHWAFRPVTRPELPTVKDISWCRTPIDRFVLARLEAAGLGPSDAADKTALLRRVTFDLTGLPPTPKEIDAFERDRAPDAYERLVDRLLDAPAYGERWAQHWLDLARFAETDGFEFDTERPNAWRYRDWVIDALARDMPYDEFVRLQLAGDELHPDDPGAVVATGFALCGPDMPDINLQEERRHNFLNDMTGTVGSILLGVQIGCAQCHDHKFDPLSQYDFYRLRAFFDPVEIFKDHPLPQTGPPRQATHAEVEMAARLKDLEARVQRLEGQARDKLKAENPDLQPTRDDLVKALSEADREEFKSASDEIGKLKKALKPPDVPQGRVVREVSAAPKPSRLMIRGDFRREGPEVGPDYPRVANLAAARVDAPGPGARTTGRRTQLADWIVDPHNPLAARVIVNRVWQFHFGRGIVETASDFGKMGAEPTHPGLLDWLAGEFVAGGWSFKRLHRLILTSAVYGQASRLPAGADAATRERWNEGKLRDPDNRLLGRFPRQRLEGEAIRDAMLAAAGRLSPRRGGPGVRPPLPAELVATLLANQWNVSPNEEDHRRRSIYLFVRRNLRYPLFEAFDRPDTNASCPRRNRSTIAPQALILLNSEFSLAMARDLAGRVLKEGGETASERITLAYRLTLGRAPSPDELQIAAQFLDVLAERLKDTGRATSDLALPNPPPEGADPFAAAALVDFCLSLYNLNEFIYVD